jgi:phosphatidylserine decarboxylase
VARPFVTLQYLLPHHLLCRIVYALSRSHRPWLKNALIRPFVRHFRPDMADAVEPDPLRYRSFNEFFTRALKPATRPVEPDPARLASPCDALLSHTGVLSGGELLQAKGQHYRLSALLAGESAIAASFEGGAYTTLYLAPYHYHRVHMPLEGRLRAAWHVPGRLFSVNAATCAEVPGLFARNERVVFLFEGPVGQFALIMVGALLVGSISSIWHGEITPWRRRSQPGTGPSMAASAAGGVHQLEPLAGVPLQQPRGAELGRFNMGSTVLLLLPPGRVGWDTALAPGTTVRMGQALGTLNLAAALRSSA